MQIELTAEIIDAALYESAACGKSFIETVFASAAEIRSLKKTLSAAHERIRVLTHTKSNTDVKSDVDNTLVNNKLASSRGSGVNHSEACRKIAMAAFTRAVDLYGVASKISHVKIIKAECPDMSISDCRDFVEDDANRKQSGANYDLLSDNYR